MNEPVKIERWNIYVNGVKVETRFFNKPDVSEIKKRYDYWDRVSVRKAK